MTSSVPTRTYRRSEPWSSALRAPARRDLTDGTAYANPRERGGSDPAARRSRRRPDRDAGRRGRASALRVGAAPDRRGGEAGRAAPADELARFPAGAGAGDRARGGGRDDRGGAGGAPAAAG